MSRVREGLENHGPHPGKSGADEGDHNPRDGATEAHFFGVHHAEHSFVGAIDGKLQNFPDFPPHALLIARLPSAGNLGTHQHLVEGVGQLDINEVAVFSVRFWFGRGEGGLKFLLQARIGKFQKGIMAEFAQVHGVDLVHKSHLDKGIDPQFVGLLAAHEFNEIPSRPLDFGIFHAGENSQHGSVDFRSAQASRELRRIPRCRDRGRFDFRYS